MINSIYLLYGGSYNSGIYAYVWPCMTEQSDSFGND